MKDKLLQKEVTEEKGYHLNFEALDTNNKKVNENNIETIYTNLLNEAGQDGRHQKFLFILFCLACFVCCLILTVFPLQKDLPDYVCMSEDDSTEEDFTQYGSSFKIITQKQCVKKFCHNSDSVPTILIVDYESKINFITELDLMCEMDSFFETMTQLVFFGRIMGNIIFSYISDKYGRYKCFVLQFGLIIFSYIIFLFVKVGFVYLFLSFVLSCCLNLYTLVSAMSTEVMSQPFYSLLNGLIGACFTLCGIIDIIVLCFLKNWIILLYLHLLVCIAVVYLIKNYLTETPHFLLDQKNYCALNEVITKISIENENFYKLKHKIEILQQYKNINKIKNRDDNIFFNPKQITQEKSNETLIESIFGPYLLVIKSGKTLTQLLKLIMLYLAMNLVFYGQILNVEKMSGNIFFNSLVIYIGEIIAEVLGGFFLQNFARTFLIVSCFSCSTFFCLFVNIFEMYDALPYVKTLFIFSNSFFISVSFVVVYVYTAEVFDTNVKTTASSILNNLSNVFMLISPYLIHSFESPFGLFALFSGMAALNGLILRETKIL